MRAMIFLLMSVCALGAKCQTITNPESDLWALSRGYLQAFEQLDFDKMGTFLHDSVKFFDIGSQAEGKSNVMDNWKRTFNPRPTNVHFEVREHFVSGSFVVIDVRYEALTKIQDKNTLVNMEVIMVLQFENEKIIMLHDYPDLTSYERQLTGQLKNTQPARNENKERNVNTTLNYYQAYSRWDVQGMGSFYHDDIEFRDLTAKDAFKGGKYEHNGKADVVKFWSGIFGDTPPEYSNVRVVSLFTAGDYVIANTIFSLVLPPSWTGNAPGKVYVTLPIKTALRFRDGKIISQHDFADYAMYRKQIEVQVPKR